MCYSFTQTCSPKRNCKRASFMVSLWHRVTSVSDIAKIFPCLLFFLDLCELGLAPIVGAREFQHVPPREHRRSRYAAALEEFWFCRPLDGFKTSCLSLSDQCLEFKSIKFFETTLIWWSMVDSMQRASTIQARGRCFLPRSNQKNLLESAPVSVHWVRSEVHHTAANLEKEAHS